LKESCKSTKGAPKNGDHASLLIAIIGLVVLFGAFCRSLAAFVGEAQSQAVTDHVHDLLHAKSIDVDLEITFPL